MLSDLTREEIIRYSRHLMIPGFGLNGQRKLKSASVLIVGSGGLGSPIALYLAAAGVGRIGIVDYDSVEPSNLQRQIIHTTNRINIPKVDSAQIQMLELNPTIRVDPYPVVFTSKNALQIAADYDILVDGTDNFQTRYLLNDLAVFTNKPYVYGSVYRYEGQVSVFDARFGPCYRCLFSNPPSPGLAPGCSEIGVVGVLPGTIGTLQATEVLKLILGIGNSLIGRLLIYDALEMSMQTIRLKKNPDCKLCGDNPEIFRLIDYDDFCGIKTDQESRDNIENEYSVTPVELADYIKQGRQICLIDVREPVEQQVSHLPNAHSIPYFNLLDRVREMKPEEEIIVFCRTGVRGARAVRLLRENGFRNAKNLKGGINAWAGSVDPELFQY